MERCDNFFTADLGYVMIRSTVCMMHLLTPQPGIQALLQVVGTLLKGLAILLFGIVLFILSLAAAKLAFLLIFGAIKMILSLLIMLIGFIGIPMPAAVAQWEPFGWF